MIKLRVKSYVYCSVGFWERMEIPTNDLLAFNSQKWTCEFFNCQLLVPVHWRFLTWCKDFGISLGQVWDIFGTFLGHFLDLIEKCFVQGLAKFSISLGQLWIDFDLYVYVLQNWLMMVQERTMNWTLKIPLTGNRCCSKPYLNVKLLSFLIFSKCWPFWAKMLIFPFFQID